MQALEPDAGRNANHSFMFSFPDLHLPVNPTKDAAYPELETASLCTVISSGWGFDELFAAMHSRLQPTYAQ